MNDLPLHPAAVHIPLGLAVVMPIVAIVVAVALFRGKLPRNAFALVAGLQLVLAGSAFVAMQLGHGEEKRAAQIAPQNAIHDHEEAAETFVWVSIAVAAVAIAALFVPAKRAPLLAAAVAAGTVVTAALAVDAGRKGGELVFRYGAGAVSQPDAQPEARPDAPQVAPAPASSRE